MAKAKAKRKSVAKTPRRRRNAGGDRSLSLDAPRDNMPELSSRPPTHPVRDSIERVIAECDKVDAALIEMTQAQELPLLTVKEIETADRPGETKRGWAVVSADPETPLTEKQAKDIVAAMRSPGTPAPIRIAAE